MGLQRVDTESDQICFMRYLFRDHDITTMIYVHVHCISPSVAESLQSKGIFGNFQNIFNIKDTLRTTIAFKK